MVMVAGVAALDSDSDVVAALELAVVPDDVDALDEVPEDLSSLEHPATHATAIVATPIAISNSRFTVSPSSCDQRFCGVAKQRHFPCLGEAFHFARRFAGDIAEMDY
jgi:hypothetical protein